MLKIVLYVAVVAHALASKAPKCGKLEVPDSCINGGCYKERKCSDINRPYICVDPRECKQGCLCKEGYLFNTKGHCIPKNECPEKLKCPRQNEVYNPCVDKCPPNTCESIGKTYHCPLKSANRTCTGSCVCEPGYYKNSIKQCISEENCKKCTGPNEYYSCGGACDNVCQTLAVRNQTSCDIINVKCNEKCYCVKGHARLKNGTCVPFDQCPGKAECGKDKVLIKCPPLYCKPRTCAQKGTKPICPRISPGLPCPGKPGCVCKSGYLEDHYGKCIPEAQCPPTCGKNEMYSNCTNGGCFGATTCDEVGKAGYRCVKIDPKNCIKGCKCIDGYVKYKNGTCISKDQCPKKDNGCNESGDESSSPSDDNEENCNTSDDNEEDQKLFSEGIATFSSRFLEETAKSKPSDNVVMSPFCVLIPLAELVLRTIGKSFNQLIQAIGLQNKCQIRTVFGGYVNGTRNLENITFNLAAIVYVNDKYEITDAFLEDTAVFGATAETIDVDEPEKAADTINTWVENQTNNNIKNLVSPTMITEDTRLFLVNAIYFKGLWKYPFDPKNTKQRDFYVSADNIQQADTMFLNTRVEYAQSEDLDAKILRLPYKNEKFSAVFILPNKIDGVDDLLDKIEDINKYNAALQSLSFVKLKIWLPKFKISTTIDLSEILKKLGVTDIFTDQSGLTGILKSGEQLSVTQAIQKAFIAVTEQGTEAAAANVIGVSPLVIHQNPPEFKADHPFVFALYYNDDMMFTGVHRKPIIGVSTTAAQLNPPEFKADHPFVFALYYNDDMMFTGVHRKPSTE